MAVIKSGVTTDQMTVGAVNKAARVELFDALGNPLLSGGNLPTIDVMPQYLDAGNTVVRTAAEGAAMFTGAWYPTRDEGVVRQLVVLASTEPLTLGGTFVFEYSEDGVVATISESRVITDFETVRSFDLLNAGKFFRIRFTPSRVLVGGEMVFITTTERTQNDGEFVRLAGQRMEEANAAMGQTFAYLKAFVEATGKSINVRANALGELITVNTPRDGTKATYSAAVVGLNPAAAATDVLVINGSGAKTLRILRLMLSGTGTAGGVINAVLVKRSTLDTLGTPVVLAPVPHDSLNPAATATVTTYTANPTLGAFVGNLRARKTFISTTATTPAVEIWGFGDRPGQAVLVRGAAEQLCVNIGGMTIAGGSLSMAIEWTEE